MIILSHPILGERSFEEEHANRLLAMDKNGGWSLKKSLNADISRNIKPRKRKQGGKVKDVGSEPSE